MTTEKNQPSQEDMLHPHPASLPKTQEEAGEIGISRRGFLGLRQYPFSSRTLTGTPRDQNPEMAFPIELWAEPERKCRS